MPTGKPLVIDASVAVKWFLPEPDADRAASLLDGRHRLIAPDLLWIEVASVLWKITRRGSLTADEAQRILADAGAFPVEIIDSLDLLPDALRIANAADRTVYDSLYVALAFREKGTLVTADDRLARGIAGTAWGRVVTRLLEA
jgi:predicted nucleic acid-binding protein